MWYIKEMHILPISDAETAKRNQIVGDLELPRIILQNVDQDAPKPIMYNKLIVSR